MTITNYFKKFQINGVDISGCSHDEATKKLEEANNPIIVEVKKRNRLNESDLGMHCTVDEKLGENQKNLSRLLTPGENEDLLENRDYYTDSVHPKLEIEVINLTTWQICE